VAILVPLLLVFGLVLLTWGAFHMIWDTRRDKIVGGVMLIASFMSLLAGAIWFFKTICKVKGCLGL